MATKEKKAKLPTIVSPKGTASFAYLREPDTEGKYADDKFKVTLKLPKSGAENQGDIDKFVKRIESDHIKARGKKKTESPVKDGDERENENDHGFYLLTFKSKFAPQLVDSKRRELADDVAPFGGDTIKVAFAALPYEEGKNAGISLQLRAVQLISKRPGANYSNEFEDEAPDSDGSDSGAAGGEGSGDSDFS